VRVGSNAEKGVAHWKSTAALEDKLTITTGKWQLLADHGEDGRMPDGERRVNVEHLILETATRFHLLMNVFVDAP
jgi:hypothetical protein